MTIEIATEPTFRFQWNARHNPCAAPTAADVATLRTALDRFNRYYPDIIRNHASDRLKTDKPIPANHARHP